jgi:hypothetical protein
MARARADARITVDRLWERLAHDIRIAQVANPIGVAVLLVRVDCERAVVTGVTHAIVIGVLLGGIRLRQAVV